MEKVILKYLNVAAIEKIAHEKKYDTIAYEEFQSYLKKNVIIESRMSLPGTWEASLLERAIEYMDLVEIERQKGFSIDWASEYVYRCLRNEEEHAVAYAYNVGHFNDIELYSKLTGRDKHFVEHFHFLLIDPGHPVQDTPAVVMADYYSEVYKQQVSQGKSAHFARVFAFFMTSYEFTEYECYIAAMEADKVCEIIDQDSDLVDFADHMSQYIYKHFDRYEDSLNDERTNHLREKYMKVLGYDVTTVDELDDFLLVNTSQN